MDTKKDGLENVSPFKNDYFGYFLDKFQDLNFNMIPNLSFPHQTKEVKTIDPPLDTILSRSPVSLGSL